MTHFCAQNDQQETPGNRAIFMGIAFHAAGAFIALSVGAAIRFYLSGDIPDPADAVAATLWGWPIGVPVYAAVAYLIGAPQ